MSSKKRAGSIQTNSVIRAFKVLEILKEETGEQNSLTQKEILNKLIEEKDDRCSAKTLKATLETLKEALNPDSWSKQIKSDFRIIHPGLIFEDEVFDEEIDEDMQKEIRMTDIYYSHPFSYDEIDLLIEGIQFSKDLDTQEAHEIIRKVKQLTNKYYKNESSFIYPVKEKSILEKKKVQFNLAKIQKAIEGKVKIIFCFNRYNHEGKLIPVSKDKYLLSPYYVAAYNGKYYLVANYEKYNNTSIYRIDLMTEIEIPEKDSSRKRKGIPSRPKKEINGLPRIWDPEDFKAKHLNMFYDDPVEIQLKVKSPNYTYIYDSFGDKFKFLRHIDKDFDMICVFCSPRAMVNWAIQYSNSVEVISPKSLRESIVISLEDSLNKYR